MFYLWMNHSFESDILHESFVPDHKIDSFPNGIDLALKFNSKTHLSDFFLFYSMEESIHTGLEGHENE